MDYTQMVQDFLKAHKLAHVLSFAGGYRKEQKEGVETFLVDIFKLIQGQPIAILTGGTDYNFPGLATAIAKDHDMKVIGVLPETGEEYPAPGLDLQIVVPPLCGQSFFCDETQVFAKSSNAMVSLGGGPGAGVEVFQAAKISLDLIYYKKPPINILLVPGFGGVSELLLDSGYYKDFPKVFSDTAKMTSGKQFAEEILEIFNLR